jgi:hypothetical protein
MYRILNPQDEPKGQILTSEHKSSFRQEVFAYRKLSHDIYIFSQKTGLQIKNAVRVAENVPAFLDLLNEFFMSKGSQYDLHQMLIDDPIKHITGDDLYAFVSNYIADINETGLYYDWNKEHYLWEFIWEMIRSYEFPNMPSRMDSLFLFDNETNAIEFKKQYRDSYYQLVTINTLGGTVKSFDMNWFSNVPSDIPLVEVKEYARNYWKQVKTEKPVMEILYQGVYSW